MSTASPTNVTVFFDPSSVSKQADIIQQATEKSAGVMTAAQFIKLDSLPFGPGLPGPAGPPGPDGPVGPTGLNDFAMFYGLTAGTGNPTSTDYAATVAAGAPVPFPRLGPTIAGSSATQLTSTTFKLALIGVYEVGFRVHSTEPGQLQLALDGTPLPETTFANMNPTAGGHPIVGTAFITTTAVDQVLTVINPAGNTPALTITPADGASTHANAQVLTIKRL